MIEEARAAGYDPNTEFIFIDVDASERFSQWRANESFTLTRARTKSGGWFITCRARRTTTKEMLMLQGIDPAVVGDFEKMPRTHFNTAIGNGMSANVLERLLPKIAYAAGILRKEVIDV